MNGEFPTGTPSFGKRVRLCRARRRVIALALGASDGVGQIAPKAPEPATLKANADLAKTLPFANREDFDDAMRGFVGTMPDAQMPGTGPRPVWSMKPYDFLKQNEAPDSVNPSLWRQAQLNAIHGLFKVTDRVYQVRGFDISNMTIIEGDTSLIIIDTLMASRGSESRAGTLLPTPAKQAGRHGDLFAQPRRSFWRREGRDQRDRRCRRQGSAAGAAGFMEAVGARASSQAPR